MTRALRTLAIGLLAAGIVVGLVGTAGFSSAAADRGVTVDTAPDERAYVGYDSPDEIVIEADENATNQTVTNGTETATLVTVTNRFNAAVDVANVEVDEKPDELNITVRSPRSDVSLGVSESETVVAELECEGAFEAEPLSVTVQLRGTGVETVVFGDTESRTVSVTCRAES